MMRALLVMGLVLLAGCSEAPDAQAPPAEQTATIAGRVMDQTLAPIAGAYVALAGTSLNALTGPEGQFLIRAPGNQAVYALRVEASGFQSASVALSSNSPYPAFNETILMSRVPVIVPYHETVGWTGTIVCEWFAQAQHSHGGPGDPGSHNSNDCSEDTSDYVWTFDVKPGVRNVIVEMVWEANSLLSERLALFLEGPGVDGGDDVLYFFEEGPSTVRATIGQLQARTYYEENGGPVRVTVKIGAPEEDVAAGLAINQSFDVFATAFYVLPGANDFTVGGTP